MAGRPSGLGPGWREAIGSAPSWDPPEVPTLVVAPHPDDECILTGGLVARLRRRGVEVSVLAVTDGGAAYPGADRAELERRRRDEQEAALGELGVDRASIRRAGLPDGEVARHEAELVDVVESLLVELDVRHVVAPWERDHHADHEAVGRATGVAAARAGVALTSCLFWGLFHATPPAPAERALVRLELTDVDRRRKAAAIDLHGSQTAPGGGVEPVLTDVELEPTTWPFELLLTPAAP